METCLVTGGTGLLGTHLLPLLIKKQYKVHVLIYEESPLLKQLPVELIQADLSLPDWQNKLPEKIDHVIHLAQSDYFREFPERALHLFTVNTASALHLMDAAVRRGAKSFIHTSTGSVYGALEKDCHPEDALEVDPSLGFYPATKLCTELLLNPYKQQLSLWTLRPFFLYGAGQQRHMLIPRLVDSVLEERPIQLQGDEGLRINPCHASDAAQIILRCLETEGSETINVAGPEELSLKEIGEIIGKTVGKEPIFTHNVDSKAPRLVGNMQKTEQVLGMAPKVKFHKGVHTVVSLC